MANIAVIKLFTGLNLAPAQLSGELKRAGHGSRVVYFKDYVTRFASDLEGVKLTELAGTLRLITHHGEQPLIYNCYEPISESEYQLLFDELREFGAQAVGFCVNTSIINESAEVSKRVQEELGLPILWGGPGPTLEPERCMPYADLLCIGEGEEVIVEAAERLERNEPLTGIDGTWSRLPDGGIQKNPNRPLSPLDSIAIPNWSTEDYVRINANRLHRGEWVDEGTGEQTEYAIMTQRGCPFSCSFCIESKYQEMFGKKGNLRRRNPQVVIDELIWAKENIGIKSVWFWDDVFTINPKWHDEFLPLYKEHIDLPFWCYTYPTTHSLELLKKLKDAGCVNITMGVQSGSRRVLAEYFNRPVREERTIKAAEEILEAGLVGSFDLISKNQIETEQDLWNTFEFLMRFPREMKSFGVMDMISFPTYGYTEKVQSIVDSGGELPNAGLSDDDYTFFHKLFRLTRTDMDREKLRELANDPAMRKNHALLNPHIGRRNILAEMVEWRNLAPLTKDIFTAEGAQ